MTISNGLIKRWSKKEKLLWLACAVDCEGSLSLENNGSKKTPFIVIYNTDKKFIHFCAQIMKTEEESRFNPGNGIIKSDKKIYKARLRGRKAIPLIKAILPYLIIKKNNAIKALNYFKKNPIITPEEMLYKLHNNPQYHEKAWKTRIKKYGQSGVKNPEDYKQMLSDIHTKRWKDKDYRNAHLRRKYK